MSQELEIRIRAIDEASKVFESVGFAAEKTAGSLEKVGDQAGETTKCFGESIVAAGRTAESFRVVGGQAEKSAESFLENSVAAGKVADSLENVGVEAKQTTDSVKNVGVEAGKTTSMFNENVRASQSLAKGLDEASSSAGEASQSVKETGKAAEKASESFKENAGSAKDLITSFSGLATSTFAVYKIFDSLQHASLEVQRANYQVEKSANAVEDAQRRYNQAVEKYGPASEQARAAAEDLRLAQERYQLAVEKARQAQQNYNEAVFKAAMAVVPAVISGIKSFHDAVEGLKAVQEIGIVVKLKDVAATVAQKAATLASAAAEVAHKIATWALNAALATKIALLTVGVGLIAAAVAVTMFMSRTTEQAAGVEQKFGETVETTSKAVDVCTESLDRHVVTLAQVRRVVSETEGQLGELRKKLDDVNKSAEGQKEQLVLLYASLQFLNNRFGDASKALSEVKQKYEEASKAAEEQRKTIEAEIAVVEESLRINRERADILTLQFEVITKASDEYRRSVEETANVVMEVISKEADVTEADLERARTAVEKFAATWGYSWEDAVKVISDAVREIKRKHDEQAKAALEAAEKQREAFQRNMDAIRSLYFDQYVKTSDAFVASVDDTAKKLDDILNRQNMMLEMRIALATSIVQQFADQWGISFSQAEQILKKAVENIRESVEQVPKTFEEQLITRAQRDLKDFQNCASGKMYNIANATGEAFERLVQDTNDLIRAGLLGQAQENIRAFVECSTNKQAKMVDDINGYIEDLTRIYQSNVEKINELTAQGLTAEAAIYERMNAEIMAKIEQLEAWKRQIISQTFSAVLAETESFGLKLSSIFTLSLHKTAESFDEWADKMKSKFIELSDVIVSRSVWTDMLIMMQRQAEGTFKVLTKDVESFAEDWAAPLNKLATGLPTAGFKAAPPAHAPIPPAAAPNLVLNAPLVNIEGSADKATAELAANLVAEKLKTVLVEATSTAAPTKRIRIMGGVV